MSAFTWDFSGKHVWGYRWQMIVEDWLGGCGAQYIGDGHSTWSARNSFSSFLPLLSDVCLSACIRNIQWNNKNCSVNWVLGKPAPGTSSISWGYFRCTIQGSPLPLLAAHVDSICQCLQDSQVGKDAWRRGDYSFRCKKRSAQAIQSICCS